MDPEAALAEMRALVAEYNEASATYQRQMGVNDDATAKEYEVYEDTCLEVVHRLVALTEGLDGWLVRGGALPKAWTRRKGNG